MENQVFVRGLDSLALVFGLMESAVSDWKEVAALTKALKLTFTECTSDLSVLMNQLQAIQGITQTFTGSIEDRPSLKMVIKEQRALLEVATNRISAIAPRARGLVSGIPELETQFQNAVQLSRSEWAELDPKANESKAQLENMKQQLNAKVVSIRPLEQNLASAVRSSAESHSVPAGGG